MSNKASEHLLKQNWNQYGIENEGHHFSMLKNDNHEILRWNEQVNDVITADHIRSLFSSVLFLSKAFIPFS